MVKAWKFNPYANRCIVCHYSIFISGLVFTSHAPKRDKVGQQLNRDIHIFEYTTH